MIGPKIKKALLITIITLVMLGITVIAFISPIAKFLVEKYSVKYLGREIKIGWLYLNPFTGYLHISHLKVYEANSDSLFFTAEGLSAKYEIFKMLSKTYEISSISLNKPVGYIIQNGRTLNFSDIIERFTPKEKRDTTKPHNPVHFNILKIVVTDGEFHYIEQSIPINYFVKNVNVESTGKWWDVDSMAIKFSLQSGPGSGDIKGNGVIDFDSLRYTLNATLTRFDLKLLEQYLRGLANYGHLAAILDAHVSGTGSFKNGLDLDAAGFIALSDFHLGGKTGDDFAAFDKLVLDADKISPKNHEYSIDSLMIGHPFFKYERYDKLNNIEMMFGKNGSTIKQANADNDAGKFNLIIEIAKYIKKLGVDFLQSSYKVDRVAIYNGDVKFNDFSLRDKFSVEASPLYLISDSINRKNERFKVAISSGIKPYGFLAATLSLDPNDFGYFDLQYKILKVPVSMFNPYVVSYTSFPLDRGTLEFNGTMEVEDSIIKSQNHLLIIDPRIAKRVKKDDTKWIPVPLIMSLIRSSGNVIDFQIPIAGNLSSPKFKFWGAIGQVMLNIFVKPPSTLYLIHEKLVEQEVEKSLALTWQTRQVELRPVQEKFVKRMAAFLKSNADAFITVSPLEYTEKEKEAILLFEAKKKYFLQAHISSNNLSEDDSITVDRMSVKDSMFIHYVDRLVGDSMMFTIQEKCEYIMGRGFVAGRFNQLLKGRENVFRSYFGESASRVKFKDRGVTIPFNGFSYYKIDYNGEVPGPLMKAYREMDELNDEAPRRKYRKERAASTAAGK